MIILRNVTKLVKKETFVERLYNAAAGDTSDYVKKQMQKYGTSLEDFKSNPDDVGTGILAGSPGFTPSGPRTADQFVDQQNRIRQLQKNYVVLLIKKVHLRLNHLPWVLQMHIKML